MGTLPIRFVKSRLGERKKLHFCFTSKPFNIIFNTPFFLVLLNEWMHEGRIKTLSLIAELFYIETKIKALVSRWWKLLFSRRQRACLCPLTLSSGRLQSSPGWDSLSQLQITSENNPQLHVLIVLKLYFKIYFQMFLLFLTLFFEKKSPLTLYHKRNKKFW